MKKISLTLVIFTMICTNLNAQNDVLSAFLIKWENSKNYLIELAEAMPENSYNYKPTERQMSFQEQLIHIQGNMEWISTKYFLGEKSEKINPTSKEETINYLKASFDKVSENIKNTPLKELTTEVDFFAGPKSKLQLLNLLQDHVTHHRGQLIVYLNLNNIEPPKYIGW